MCLSLIYNINRILAIGLFKSNNKPLETEIITAGPVDVALPPACPVIIGMQPVLYGATLPLITQICSLGECLDSPLSMDIQVLVVARSACAQLKLMH